ncbi:hypothetical protein EIP91_005193, partial [Steccherinum ochraceum]
MIGCAGLAKCLTDRILSMKSRRREQNTENSLTAQVVLSPSTKNVFSHDGVPGVIPPRQRTHAPSHVTSRPLSPRTQLSQEIRAHPPDEPFIPYVPTGPPSISPTVHGYEEPLPVPVPVREPVPHVVAVEPPLEAPQVLVEPPPAAPPLVHTISTPPTHGYPLAATPPLPVVSMPADRPVSMYPGDLAYADAERERAERFDDIHGRLVELNRDAEEAEERRDTDFRGHEDERERIFNEHEQRREQEAAQTRDEIIRLLEERLAAIPQLAAPPSPPRPAEYADDHAEGTIVEGGEPVAGTPGAPSIHDSERRSIIEQVSAAASGAATQYAEELRDTVRLEREELAREREGDRIE